MFDIFIFFILSKLYITDNVLYHCHCLKRVTLCVYTHVVTFVSLFEDSHTLSVHNTCCHCLKNSWLRFSALASLPPPSLKSIFDFWYLLIVVIWLLIFANCYLIIDICSLLFDDWYLLIVIWLLLFTHCYLMIEMTNLQVIRPSVTSTALSADWTQLQIISNKF